MSLINKTILITGAAGGLGSTAALALAQQQATVILVDHRLSALEEVYDRIIAKGGQTPILHPFNLAGANEADYQQIAEVIAEKFGALDGLLHSALAFTYFSPLAQHSTQEWLNGLTVNLNAAFVLTRTLLPVLQRCSTQASVVFTSDAIAIHPKAYSGIYAISKAALEAMVTIWADELAGKVRMNLLIPGAVDCPFRKKAFPAEDKSQLKTMDSLIPLYQYLFSEASAHLNGQRIIADSFLINFPLL
jgi:NAD(P)-dependent dehydrogenase (short-subunit alcohol dehydrogenase family)